MKEAIIQVICAGIGTLGFALFFNVRRSHLPMATLGGALSWVCYLLVFHQNKSFFLASLVAALAICLWSETLARIRKAPANTFLIPGIVPLLPGSALYRCMSAVVHQDMDIFIQKGTETLMVAVGIAGGILIASELVRLFFSVRLHHQRAKAKKEALALQRQEQAIDREQKKNP